MPRSIFGIMGLGRLGISSKGIIFEEALVAALLDDKSMLFLLAPPSDTVAMAIIKTYVNGCAAMVSHANK